MKLEQFGERGPVITSPSAPSKKQKEFKPFLHERDTTGKILPSFCTSPINVQSKNWLFHYQALCVEKQTK